MPEITDRVLDEIAYERTAQDQKWGEQNHPNGTNRILEHFAIKRRLACQRAARDGNVTWRHILDEEVAEASAAEDPTALRAELVQVAAVAVAWIEAIDRRAAREPQ